MNEIVFLVEEDPEGGYSARALGESVFTEGETEEDLNRLANIEELLTDARQFDELNPGGGYLETYLENAWLTGENGLYDVQDPDPLELWHSDPFKPEIRDGLIFARGATDDKGQVLAHLKAAARRRNPAPAGPTRRCSSPCRETGRPPHRGCDSGCFC